MRLVRGLHQFVVAGAELRSFERLVLIAIVEIVDFVYIAGWVLQVCVLLRRYSPILVANAEPLAYDALSRSKMFEEVVDVHAALHVLVHRAQYAPFGTATLAACRHFPVYG